MKILANRKIKALFYKIMVCMLIFIVVSVSFMMFELNNAALYILLCALFMCIAIMAAAECIYILPEFFYLRSCFLRAAGIDRRACRLCPGQIYIFGKQGDEERTGHGYEHTCNYDHSSAFEYHHRT